MASEYLKWKYRDVHPDQPAEMTKKQRRRNWWHYHKVHLLLIAVVLLIGVSWIYHVVTQVHPDYQIAYVASTPLSDEDVSVWEAKLAALGTDCNEDGKIVVRLNQYITAQDSELAMYNYASNVKLMADLEDCESYFFLLEDPEGFQAGYEVLQEYYLPQENGLYLARREFWEERTPKYLEDYDLLWEQLIKEAE